ncbi:MAG: hypothetical protein ACLRUB_00030 [Streptococcus sp.]
MNVYYFSNVGQFISSIETHRQDNSKARVASKGLF